MNDADWLEIVVTVMRDDEAEAAATVLQLFALGDEGVAIEQVGDPNDLDPKALLPETLVKLYVNAERDSAELRSTLKQSLNAQSLPSPAFNLLKNEDWANAWKENFKPLRIGEKFWIKPSWIEEEPPNASDIVLHMDPGMAFGTGTHETTQLCMTLLEQHVHAGMSVLDVGTGSGILSIGAAKLGAKPILAFDNDPLAVEATKRNALDNDVSDSIDVRKASVVQIEPSRWDVVIVNILAVIIQKLLLNESLMSYVNPNGVMLMSGILQVQAAEMQHAIEMAGGHVDKVIQKNDWVAMVVYPRTVSK